ncbi:MAG: ABC transporter permease DevC [Cyanobacteria bacterium P01_D01_bin.123]
MRNRWRHVAKILKTLPVETPLAWSQLSHQKLRFLVALGGIAFANILIFMQLGFRALFTEGATLIADNLQGDLFILNPQTDFLGAGEFDRIHLFRVSSVKGVESVVPVYIDYDRWSFTEEYATWGAQIIAFNPDRPVLNLPVLNEQLWKLKLPNTVLVDRQSKPTEFGPVAETYERNGPFSALLVNRRVEVVGLFNLGSSFFRSDGKIVVSEMTYRTLLGPDSLESVGVGVVILEPGADLASVQQAIAENIPAVQAFTHAELVARDLNFQQQNPAGAIFSFGAVMGFIVGVVVVYQVLYADVTDHLPEYATLKAIGFSDRALLVVVFQEALILGTIGFLPGFGVSLWMYGFLANLTRLELVMRLDVAITVLVLTLTMCLLSATIASSKLRSADPADVFS